MSVTGVLQGSPEGLVTRPETEPEPRLPGNLFSPGSGSGGAQTRAIEQSSRRGRRPVPSAMSAIEMRPR
jgi:hypothetical protein